MNKLLPILLLFLFACAGQKPAAENTVVVKASTLATTPANTITSKTETIKSNAENLKPIINFFRLANKSAKEIEKIYGKPDVIDTKYIQSKNGEFRVYNKDGERFLQVDYFDGKAVAFYLEIPEASQSQSPDETLKVCGLNVRFSDSQPEKLGFWWDTPSGSEPFYRVRISKYQDSGAFYNCEVHTKVK